MKLFHLHIHVESYRHKKKELFILNILTMYNMMIVFPVPSAERAVIRYRSFVMFPKNAVRLPSSCAKNGVY